MPTSFRSSRLPTLFRLSLALAALSPLLAEASVGDTLSLAQSLDLAMRHNPRLQGAAGSLRQSEGQWVATRSTLWPQIGLQGGAQRSGRNGASLASGGQQREAVNSTDLQASLRQTLWDFGRTQARVEGGDRSRLAAQQTAEAVRQDVMLGVMQSYYGLWQAEAVAQVQKEALKQAEAHWEQAQSLLSAGSGTRYLVIKAEVDVENARLVSVRSENAKRLAKEQLQNAIGFPLPLSPILSDSLSTDNQEGAATATDAETAARLAVEKRPETQAARLKLEATRQNAIAANRAFWPALSGQAGYGVSAQSPEWGWRGNWQVGVNVSLPLFDGGALRGARMQAEGSVESALADLSLEEQSVALDAREQALAWQEANQSVSIAARLVAQATLGLELSQERYRTGAGNFLELMDAELALSQARIARIQALVDRRLAKAKLLRAQGEGDIAAQGMKP